MIRDIFFYKCLVFHVIKKRMKIHKLALEKYQFENEKNYNFQFR